MKAIDRDFSHPHAAMTRNQQENGVTWPWHPNGPMEHHHDFLPLICGHYMPLLVYLFEDFEVSKTHETNKNHQKSSSLADSRNEKQLQQRQFLREVRCALHLRSLLDQRPGRWRDGGIFSQHCTTCWVKQLRKILNGFLQLVLWNWRTWGDFSWQVGNYDKWYAGELKLQVRKKRVTKHMYI